MEKGLFKSSLETVLAKHELKDCAYGAFRNRVVQAGPDFLKRNIAVAVAKNKQGDFYYGFAILNPKDKWNKKKGILLAARNIYIELGTKAESAKKALSIALDQVSSKLDKNTPVTERQLIEDGIIHGRAGINPISEEKAYLKGYDRGNFERLCKKFGRK